MDNTRLQAKAIEGIAYDQAISSMGMYPKAVSGGSAPYERRSPAQEAHNRCLLEIRHRIVEIHEFILKCGCREALERALLEDLITIDVDKLPNVDGKGEYIITMSVNCNDVFYWACSDSEDITVEELPALFACCEENPHWGSMLWVCRKRHMRPQTPWYKEFDEATAAAFNACGAPRTDD